MFSDNERIFIKEIKQNKLTHKYTHKKDYLFLKETQQFLRKLSSHLKSSIKRKEKYLFI